MDNTPPAQPLSEGQPGQIITPSNPVQSPVVAGQNSTPDSSPVPAQNTVIQPQAASLPVLTVISPTGVSAGDLPAQPIVTPQASIPPAAAQASVISPTLQSQTPQATVIGATPLESATVAPVSFNSLNQPTVKTFKHSKKLVFLLLPLLVFVIGGSAAAYFGIVVPNKPANVWHEALQNMGVGTDKLISYSSTSQKTIKGITAKGSYNLAGSTNSKGTINLDSYGKNGDFSTSFGLNGSTVSFELRSIIADKATSPDIYFKVGGLKQLAAEFSDATSSYASVINSLDNQWIVIDHSYLDSLISSADTNAKQPEISADDVTAAEQALNDVNKQWLWNDDKTKAVLDITKNVGKEKQDNRTVYHYIVHLDKPHTIQYLETLRDKFKTTKLYTDLNSSAFTGAISPSDSEIEQDVNNLDTSKPFDVWVDMHTKLIHKIRFTNTDGYFDIGQDYQGGNKFPFSMAEHDRIDGVTNDFSLQATLDSKANSIDMSVVDTSGKDKFTLNLTISQNNSSTSIQAPAGAKSITDVLNQLGFGDLADPATLGDTYSSTQSSAQDTKRQVDINALQAQFEAYFAQNGYYPSLADVNNTSWVATNLRGLDAEAFCDPSQTSPCTLAAKPAVGVYAYAVTNADGSACTDAAQDCQQYTLTATLSDGSAYAKSSLD